MKKNDGKLISIAVILQVMTFIISLAKVKILTNLLSIDDYGVYSVLINTMGFIIFAMFFGLDRYLIKEQDNHNRQEVFKFLCLLLLVASFITIVLVVLLKKELNTAILLFIISTIFLGISQINRFYIYSGNEINRYNYLGFFMNNGWVIILIAFYFIKKPGELSLNTLFIFMIIGSLYSIIYSVKTIPITIIKVKINKETLIKGFRYSLPLLPMVYANFILRLADKYTLMFLSSNDELANYNVALSIMNIIVSFVTVTVEIYRPRIIQDKSEENAKEYITNSISLILLLSLPATIMSIFFSMDIVSLISNSSYMIASKIMMFTTILGFCISILSVNVTVAERKGDSKLIFRSYFVGTLINVVLNLVSVYFLGSYGAVLSGIVSYCFIFYIISRGNKFMDYINYKNIKPVIFSNILFFIFVFMFRFVNLNFIIKSIILAATYSVILVGFNKELIKEILQKKQKKKCGRI